MPDPEPADATMPYAWLDRRFADGTPPELAPNLIARLTGAPCRLEESTRDLPAASLIRRRDGSWSIQENAGHLGDLEELWAARITDYLEGAETLTPWEPSNAATYEANHNARELDEVLATFRGARGRLLARLAALSPTDHTRTARHPRLETPMAMIDLLVFIAEHDDHHLARILELRSAKPSS